MMPSKHDFWGTEFKREEAIEIAPGVLVCPLCAQHYSPYDYKTMGNHPNDCKNVFYRPGETHACAQCQCYNAAAHQ